MLVRLFTICFLVGFGAYLAAATEALIARRHVRAAIAAEGLALVALDRDRAVACRPGQWPYSFIATAHGALVAGGACSGSWRGEARVVSISILR